MKIELLDLEFNSEYFYIQKRSIVEKITFNNRTLYSKFEKYKTPLSSMLLKQHHKYETTLGISLVEDDLVNYLVIEYQQDDWNSFYFLIKHLLKSLDINTFYPYKDIKNNLFQLFISVDKLNILTAYHEVENIKHLLELKSKKSYKIYPDKNLPKNFNIITLPRKKL